MNKPQQEMMDQMFLDLLHVFDHWKNPSLSDERLQEFVELGWIWWNPSEYDENVGWEVTHRGWACLEQAKLVGMPYE